MTLAARYRVVCEGRNNGFPSAGHFATWVDREGSCLARTLIGSALGLRDRAIMESYSTLTAWPASSRVQWSPLRLTRMPPGGRPDIAPSDLLAARYYLY